MSKLFFGPKNRIEVGLRFDERQPELLAVAKALATRTGMTLRLAHVVEGFLHGVPPTLLNASRKLTQLAEAVDEQRHRAAASRLDAVRSTLNATSESTILSGDVVTALGADATLNQGRVVLVGTDYRPHSPIAFASNALRLMSQAPVPVLVAGRGAADRLTRPRPRILIADDLSAGCERAVLAGIDLARAMEQTDVLHLHVNTVTFPRIREAIGEVVQAFSPEAMPPFDEHEIMIAAERSLEAELRRRAPEHVSLLEASGGTYRVEIGAGEILSEIERVAKSFDADIIVFGRHHLLHREPAHWGHVPYYQMLRHGLLTMVVPA